MIRRDKRSLSNLVWKGIKNDTIYKNIMGNQQVSIIAVNAGDIASLNQAKYLLEKLPWKSLGEVEGKAAYKLSDARMWIFPNGILFEDNIDKRWLNCG